MLGDVVVEAEELPRLGVLDEGVVGAILGMVLFELEGGEDLIALNFSSTF